MIPRKKLLIGAAFIAVIIAFFFLASQASPTYFEELGLSMSLPLFTFLIAIIDGFNPCTMWVLTFLLVLLISVSHSRKRIFAVGYTFVIVVYIIYFMFMAAWLNIFLFLGYIDPLRIIIGSVAIIAGLISCKDYFTAKEDICVGGVCDTSKPADEGFLRKNIFKRMEKLQNVIVSGSMPALLIASVVLALFASLVELPCTAGWPLIYTKILAEKAMESLAYYGYIALYNLFYVIPLAAIIAFFGYFFREKEISKSTMRLIKLIGGFIMILLGIILLINPGLLAIV